MDNLERLWDDYRRFDFTAPDIARLRKFLTIEGAAVLDVGCGSGILLDALRRAGASDLVGIELSAKKAEIALRMIQQAKIYVDSYENVELPESSFDLITAFDLIEHLYRPGDFFRFAARLLKPDGIVYIKTPNWNAARRYGTRWQGLHQDPEHIYYFDRYSLENYFARVGIAMEEVDYTPISAGFGSTRCTSATKPSANPLRMIYLARTCFRSLPILSRLGYKMLYQLRRLKNHKDIALGTAHELIAVGRKGYSWR
ncbi:MAG: class I SAM-dependent methyltransferase [Deltaproteobacteria bacterium]|nr:class I SAM-dependent methyltransferase [Deltaproteobacteria bacterium]